jgi:hypothetical protein
MGKIIQIKTNQIRPSQNFVKKGTIEFILKCIMNDETNKLPPIPIVRNNPNGQGYIAIDGHNLIIMRDLFGENCEVYLANSATDGLKDLSGVSSDAIKQRNEDLLLKYDSVLDEMSKLEKDGIFSFDDLRMQYKFLESLDLAKRNFSAIAPKTICL